MLFRSRSKQQLFLVRDRFGVKPLYYSLSGEELAFASEIKALIQDSGYNYNIIRDYLATGLLCHDSQTFFKGVCSIPPASYLQFCLKTRKIEKVNYWELTDHWKPNQCFDEDLEEVHELLKDSMRLNLVSDVEVAISLSSGLDSSLLACIAQHYQANFKAFTFGFEQENYDEEIGRAHV